MVGEHRPEESPSERVALAARQPGNQTGARGYGQSQFFCQEWKLKSGSYGTDPAFGRPAGGALDGTVSSGMTPGDATDQYS